MNGDNKNLILAIVLSVVIMLGWQFFFAPKKKPVPAGQETAQTLPGKDAANTVPAAPAGQGASSTAAAPIPGAPATKAKPRAAVIAASPRVKIDTESLTGSINLKGGRLDDLKLKKYHETVDPKSPIITLLSPAGAKNAYFAETGWAPAAGSKTAVPGPDTVWSAPDGAQLAAGKPVTITWDNGQGLLFSRTFTVDKDYMFTVTQTVKNTSDKPVTLFPYARVQRHGVPKTQGYYVLHEGLVGVLDGDLFEVKYKDLMKDDADPQEADSKGGWLGITDKYWAAAVIPASQKERVHGRFFHQKAAGTDIFQSDYLSKDGVTIAPGAKAQNAARIFAGAKVVNLINAYEKKFGIGKFDLLIDWGWFYFITKPMFWLLHLLFNFLGNYGLAILAATLLIKLVLFPLSNKSYASMAKMKKLQPELTRIKELYKDDKMKQQQAMMELYKKHKVSPMAGCLPMLVQIPIFFSLYKVLFVTIEMRHAPFYGWIRDLSAPDPTSLFNLFGLIPWTPPQMLMIGVLPLIMGITMWVQMRLNPTPPDPIQAQMFNWMPLIFTFMLGTFPAGLVLYWAWNNFLSIIQQAYIMKKNGVEVHIWQNIKDSLPFLKKAGSGQKG